MICFDEVPYRLIADKVEPHPLRPGVPAKEDYTYRRLGVWNLLVAFHPALGQRRLELHKYGTAKDYTAFMQRLAALLPDAEKIILIQDNLNTHSAASFYKCLPPDQAFALAHLFEFHFTPKHASWLNIVEIEPSVMLRTCLNARVVAKKELMDSKHQNGLYLLRAHRCIFTHHKGFLMLLWCPSVRLASISVSHIITTTNARFASFETFAASLLDFIRFRYRSHASVRWQERWRIASERRCGTNKIK